jgi:magnesium chelatase family protein
MAVLCGESEEVCARSGATGSIGPIAGPDLRDVRGHAHGRLALEVAAAGGHHVALVGSPGVGKTLLAERLPGILPDLGDEDALEVAALYSVAGQLRPAAMFARPPVQAPHHSASSAAVLGAVHGSRVGPGAATLAHRGVLFLDEAPEFARPALEGLRQPLESGSISLARSGWAGRLPARFQLVVAANPCPCGHRSGSGAGCSCAPAAVRRYASRLSGPLLDRIDIRLVVGRPSDAELDQADDADCSDVVRARVTAARLRSATRFADRPWRANADIPAGELRRNWRPDAAGAELLRSFDRRAANLRGPDRVLRMAWTLADLGGRPRPVADDIAVALGLRGAGLAWTS